ncbi:MAG: hypothetical protein SX243_20430, partial [Acidobacteriota bacterium]|nr:hypothetical protein [Acidobacteriota bacterium]
YNQREHQGCSHSVSGLPLSAIILNRNFVIRNANGMQIMPCLGPGCQTSRTPKTTRLPRP